MLIDFVLFLTLFVLALELWLRAQTTSIRVTRITPPSPPLPSFEENRDSNAERTQVSC